MVLEWYVVFCVGVCVGCVCVGCVCVGVWFFYVLFVCEGCVFVDYYVGVDVCCDVVVLL